MVWMQLVCEGGWVVQNDQGSGPTRRKSKGTGTVYSSGNWRGAVFRERIKSSVLDILVHLK